VCARARAHVQCLTCVWGGGGGGVCENTHKLKKQKKKI